MVVREAVASATREGTKRLSRFEKLTFIGSQAPKPQKESNDNVRVVVRIRPLRLDELANGGVTCLTAVQKPNGENQSPTKKKNNLRRASPRKERSPSPWRRLALAPPRPPLASTSMPNRGRRSQTPLTDEKGVNEKSDGHPTCVKAARGGVQQNFEFDSVFSAKVTQKELYDATVGNLLVNNTLAGRSTTVVAYGQSGSGKTFTMSGHPDLLQHDSNKLAGLRDGDGVISRAFHDLFRAKEQMLATGDVELRVSFMEIARDQIRDALAEGESEKALALLHSGTNVEVKGLRRIPVHSTGHALELLAKAQKRLKTPTKDGSHMICTINILISPRMHKGNAASATHTASRQVVKVTLVDLAGTRKRTFKGSLPSGSNKDLLVFENVVTALSEKSKKGVRHVHVPYRESKLTSLLRDSFGGHCSTMVLAHVSPSVSCFEDALQTLRTGEHMRSIQNNQKPGRAMTDPKLPTPRAQKPRVTKGNQTKDVGEVEVMASKEGLQSRTGQVQRGSTKRSTGAPVPFLEAREPQHRGSHEGVASNAIASDEGSLPEEREDCDRNSLDGNLETNKQQKCEIEGRLEAQIQAQQQTLDRLSSRLREIHDPAEDSKPSQQPMPVGIKARRNLFGVGKAETNQVTKMLETERDTLAKNLRESQHQTSALRMTIQDLETRLNNLTNEFDREQALRRTREHDIEVLTEELSGKRRERDLLQDKVKQLTQASCDMVAREHHEETRKELDKARTEILRLTTELDTLKGAQECPTVEEEVEIKVRHHPEPADDESEGGVSALSDASSPKAIRVHAAKMLLWASEAIGRGRGSRSVCSSVASSNGSEFRPNPKDLQPPTGPVPRVITSKAGLPPRMARKVATIEGDAVINNMDKIKNAGCTCQSSLFSGNAEHVEFFLPKLGQACSCGKQPKQEEPVLDSANPTALSNILRPWQVQFLASLDLHDAVDFVKAVNKRRGIMEKQMRLWRKQQKFPSVKTKSCGIALHIWSRTCKTIVRSVRNQQAMGATVIRRPAFLDVSLDGKSVSTFGCEAHEEEM